MTQAVEQDIIDTLDDMTKALVKRISDTRCGASNNSLSSRFARWNNAR